MKNVALFFAVGLLLILFSACEEEIDTTACTNRAVVDREFAPDCEVTLVLSQGERVIPTWLRGPIFCPVGIDFSYYDSLRSLLRHGDTVHIGYEIIDRAEYCQNLPLAFIHCLETDQPPEPAPPSR